MLLATHYRRSTPRFRLCHPSLFSSGPLYCRYLLRLAALRGCFPFNRTNSLPVNYDVQKAIYITRRPICCFLLYPGSSVLQDELSGFDRAPQDKCFYWVINNLNYVALIFVKSFVAWTNYKQFT